MKKLVLNRDLKIKEFEKKYNDSINNVMHYDNCPDEIYFCGKEYSYYQQKNCVPFIYLVYNNENKLFFGKSGGVHGDIYPKIFRYLIGRGYDMNSVLGTKQRIKNNSTLFWRYFIENLYDITANVNLMIKGRFFLIETPVADKKFVIFSFWEMGKFDLKFIKEIITQVVTEYNLR